VWCVRIDGRPRYDPGTYDSYCARSRNERSLHDLPLLDPARSPIRRYSDLLIANKTPHTRHRLYLPAAHRYDYVSIDAEVDASRRKRTVHGSVARPEKRETRNWLDSQFRPVQYVCWTLRSLITNES